MGIVPFHCEVCKTFGRTVPLYRVNLKGEDGVWRCWVCLTPEQRKNVDPEVKRICEILQQKTS